jgi:cell division protein FtsB
LLVMSYFAFHAVSGNTGLVAWQRYKIERAVAEAQAAQVHADKLALAHQVKLLDPAHVDPDYADELVRRNLGVVRPDEIIVPLPDVAPGSR